MAAVMHVYKRGGDSAQTCEEIQEIRSELSDCTDGKMVYVVVRHDKKAQRGTGTQAGGGSESKTMSDGRQGGSGASYAQGVMGNVDCTQTSSVPSGARVSKRRSRRPTTSTLSDKVWREMRKQVTGRGQDDGVT